MSGVKKDSISSKIISRTKKVFALVFYRRKQEEFLEKRIVEIEKEIRRRKSENYDSVQKKLVEKLIAEREKIIKDFREGQKRLKLEADKEASVLDRQIIAVQNSTRTTIPSLAPLHNFLRSRSRFYYQWHLNPNTKALHLIGLVLYVVSFALTLKFLYAPMYQRALAAGNTCLWKGTTSNNWDVAENWTNCGGISPDSNDSIKFSSSYNNPLTMTSDKTVTGVESLTGDNYSNTFATSNNKLTVNGNIIWQKGTLSLTRSSNYSIPSISVSGSVEIAAAAGISGSAVSAIELTGGDSTFNSGRELSVALTINKATSETIVTNSAIFNLRGNIGINRGKLNGAKITMNDSPGRTYVIGPEAGGGTSEIEFTSYQNIRAYGGTAVDTIRLNFASSTTYFYGSATIHKILVDNGTLEFRDGRITIPNDPAVGKIACAAGESVKFDGFSSLVVLRSDVAGQQWDLEKNATCTVTVTKVDLKDANNTDSGSGNINVTGNSINSGNNTGFSFATPLAPKYWINDTGGTFSDNANWSTTSGGANDTTAPGASDYAYFDGEGTGNCDLAATTTVAGILNNGYLAALSTQNYGLTATYYSIWTSGTLNAGSSTITSAFLTIDSPGTVNASTSTIIVTNTLAIYSGTFNKDTGLVLINGAGVGNIFFKSGASLNNLEIDKTTVYLSVIGGNTSLDVLPISGNFTQTSGGLNSSVNVWGDYYIGAGSANASSGNGAVIFDYASNNHQVTSEVGGIGAKIKVDKSGGSVTINNDINLYGWEYVKGTVNGISNHRLTIGGTMGGTFIPGSLTYSDVEIKKTNSSQYTEDVQITGTAAVAGNFYHTDGEVKEGQINLAGNYVIAADAAGGIYNATQTTINLNGAGTQEITYTAGGIGSTVRISKDTGSVNIPGDVTIAGFEYDKGTVTGYADHTIKFGDDQNGTFIPNGLTFGNVTVYKDSINGCCNRLTITGTANVTGTLYLQGGQIYTGTIAAKGAVNESSSFDVGTGSLTLNGTVDQTYNLGGGSIPLNMTVDKASGKATITGGGTMEGNIQLSQGNLYFGGGYTYNWTAGKSITTSAGTLLAFKGSVGSVVTLTANGGGICNGTSFVFCIEDSGATIASYVNVTKSKNIAGTIYAINGTDGGSNTGWDFTTTARTWDRGAGTDVWNDGNNWNPDGVPDPNDTATLNNSYNANPITTNADINYGTLTLGDTNATTLLLSNNLGVAGSLTIGGSGTLEQANMVQQQIYGDVDVQANGVITHSANNNVEAYKINLKVNGDITVAGQVSAADKGYASGQGPCYVHNTGGTHGGRGRSSVCTPYGVIDNPTSLGGSATSGPGGGAVIINSTGTISVSGTITSRAVDRDNMAGAGGSVNLTAATLSGAGSISAQGSGSTNGGVSGGGGRISLAGVNTDNFTGTLSVEGGNPTLGGVPNYTYNRGRAGTIYLNAAKRASWTIANGQTYRLGTDTVNNYTFGAITIQSGGVLEIDGDPVMNSNNGGAATINATSIDVQGGSPGGILRADGLGFARAQGPGGNSRPAYGGVGASPYTQNTYGSAEDPRYLGSGGDDAGNAAGGGAIILNVSGTVTAGGSITANGNNISNSGTGGSINITANTLDGAGTIEARSGNGNVAGGGGRISLKNVANNNFSGTLSANANSSLQEYKAYTGTIVMSQTEIAGTLTIGGVGHVASLRLGSDSIYNYTFNNIVINSGGTLEIDGNPKLNSPNGGAATLTAVNVTVNGGGILRSNSLGFGAQRGPGYSGTNLSGGSYGGVGGNGAAVYGDQSNPINLGSGGTGTIGGGILRLQVTGTLVNAGTISANAANSPAGAGSGGTINIDANVINAAGGIITANAGNGLSGAGGGGGGRIALRAYSTYTGPSTLTANGGTGTPAGANGSVYINAAPAASALTSPGNGVSNQSQNIAFNFNSTDTSNCKVDGGGAGTCTPDDGDYVRYKLQLADDDQFEGADLHTFTQTSGSQEVTDNGLTITFSNQDQETNTSYSSARNVIATVKSTTPLVQGHVYYWRVYGIDTTGSPNGGGIDSWDSSEHWGAASSVYSFTVAPIDKTVMSAGSGQTVRAGECSAVLTFEIRNSIEEAVKLTSNVTFGLNDGGASGGFYSDSQCNTGLSDITVTAGNSLANFYYKNNNPNPAARTLTVTDNPPNATTWTDATGTININPQVLDHFTFTGYDTTRTTDQTFSGTVTAYDTLGNVKWDYYGTNAKIWFTSTADSYTYPTILPAKTDSRYQFVQGDAGTKTFNAGFQIRKTGTHTIMLHHQAYDGKAQDQVSITSSSITVNPGEAFDFTLESYPSSTPDWSKYVISGSTWDIGGTGAPYSPKVTVKDQFANTKTDYTDRKVWFELYDKDLNPAVYSFTYDTEGNAYTFLAGENGVHTFGSSSFMSESSGRDMKLRVRNETIHRDFSIYIKPLGLDHFTIETSQTLSKGGVNWDQSVDSKFKHDAADVSVTVTAYDVLGYVKTDYAANPDTGYGYIYFWSPERDADDGSGNYLSNQELPYYRDKEDAADTTHCFAFPAESAGVNTFTNEEVFQFLKGGRRKVYVRECVTPNSSYATGDQLMDDHIQGNWPGANLVKEGVFPAANPPDTIAVTTHKPGSTHANDQHTINDDNNFTVGPGDQKLTLSWQNSFDVPTGADAKMRISQSTNGVDFSELATPRPLVNGAGQWQSQDITGLINDQHYWFKLRLEYKRSDSTIILSDYSIVQDGIPKAIAPIDVTSVQLDRTDGSHPGQVRVTYKLRFDSAVSFSYFNPALLSWNAISDSAVSGDKGVVSGNFDNPINHTTYLEMNTDFPEQYLNGSFKIRVNVSVEGQGTSNSESNLITLDTKNPTSCSLIVNATGKDVATLTINASDNSNPIQMLIANSPDFAGANWEAYSTSKTNYNIQNAETVYIKFRDLYFNDTTVSTQIRPIPQHLEVKDGSNIASGKYRLLLIWDDAENVSRYNVWRASDGGNYSQIDTTVKNAYVDINLNDQTTYGFKVTSEDAAGNISLPAGPVSSRPGAAPDVTADPQVELFGWKQDYGVRAKITWQTDQLADSFVVYSKENLAEGTSTKTASGQDASIAGDVSIVNSHEVWLYNLEASTKYYFKALSKNEIQITGYSAVLSFTTLERVPLLISGMKISDITNNSAIATWETNKPSVSLIEYGQTNSYGQTKEEALNTSHSAKMENLSSGAYHLRIKATDTDENYLYSDDYTFEIPPTPEISDVSVADVTSNTATISWKTNINADSAVEYGTSAGAYSGTQGKADSSTLHSATLIGLEAKTTYHFRARSVDSLGNIANSPDQSFITSSDTASPKIENVKTEISSTGSGENIKYQVVILWDTDEPATSLIEYGQGLGGDYQSKSQENLSYNQNHVVIINELKPNSAYHFHAASADKAGNTGTSDDQTFITPPKEKSALQLIIRSLEDTFSWMGRVKDKVKNIGK